MTNTNVNGNGGYPSFAAKRTAQSQLNTQIWIVEKDGANYKITSKADNRSLKETAGYVISTYNAPWNTYRIYTSPDGRQAIQQDQNALGISGDAYFWGISGSQLKQTTNIVADDSQLQFRFVPVNESSGIHDITPARAATQSAYTLMGTRASAACSNSIIINNEKKYLWK